MEYYISVKNHVDNTMINVQILNEIFGLQQQSIAAMAA